MVTTDLVLRRITDGPRRFRSGFRPVRRYELRYSTGERRLVTPREMDALLNARRVPADFWSCVNAADAAFGNGELEALIEWPSGRRAIP